MLHNRGERAVDLVLARQGRIQAFKRRHHSLCNHSILTLTCLHQKLALSIM